MTGKRRRAEFGPLSVACLCCAYFLLFSKAQNCVSGFWYEPAPAGFAKTRVRRSLQILLCALRLLPQIVEKSINLYETTLEAGRFLAKSCGIRVRSFLIETIKNVNRPLVIRIRG